MRWLHLRSLGALMTMFLGIGCSSQDIQPPEEPVRVPSFWRGDGVAGKPRIVIDLTRQRLLYFKGEKLVGESPVSSGREGYSTRTGSFRIIQKDLHHRSSLYGSYVRDDGTVVEDDVDVRKDPRPPGTKFLGANMRYFMRIVGAIGMHEGYLPGYPASHGCIRLPSRMAAIFFHETPLGTPVQVIGNARLAPPQPTIPVRHQEPPAAQPAPAPNGEEAAAQKSEKPKVQPAKARRFQRRAAKPRGGAVPPGTTLYLYPKN